MKQLKACRIFCHISGNSIQNHLVFGLWNHTIFQYTKIKHHFGDGLCLCPQVGRVTRNYYRFGAHPVGLPSWSFSVNALLHSKTYRIFTKQFKDNNSRDINTIWKWEISKKVTKFLLYNILLMIFEVLTVVYMKNMMFCNVQSCSLTSTKLHGITFQKTVIFKLLLTGFYTYLFHGAESFLRSSPVLS
jgi:hypothetical protein